jgi:outer membrane protein TolC
MNPSTRTFLSLIVASILAAPVFLWAQEPGTSSDLSAEASAKGDTLPGEIDLPTALRFALDHNFAIRQARENIKEQEGVIIETRAAVLPNVVLNSQYQRTEASLEQGFGPGAPAPSDLNWSITLEATQALFAGGKFSAAIRGAKDIREAALYEMQGAINDALLDVRTKFYAVLLNQEEIKVQEQNLELLQQQYKDAKSRYDAGAGAQFDLLRAEVAVANGRPPLIQARNTYRISLEQLRQALGLASGSPGGGQETLTLAGSLDCVPAQFDLDAALAAAATTRPELLRYARLQSSEEQNIKAAKADYWPTLNAVGGYEVLNRTFPSDTNNPLYGWLVGLQSNWAVFDGRATAGKIMQARSQEEQARLTLLNEQLSVEVEVRQAYSSFEEAGELVAASAKTVEQAEEAVREAHVRYSAGTATELDVLQSQVDLTTARTNLIQSNYSYDVAVATLRRAMGVADKFELRE